MSGGAGRYIVLAVVSAAAILGTAAWSASAAAPSPEEQEGIIFERQQIMLQLGRDSELLGKIVAGTAPADKLAEATRAVARGARDSVTSFADQVPGGRTKQEAWSNYPDFMQRMEAFARNADAMAKAGEKGDMNTVMGLMIDALPCKQCHDVYRAPKKS